jgi:hypothetical protein
LTGALACAECGEPVTVSTDRALNLLYVHATPPADGHRAELPPVTVAYRHDGIWTDVSCPDLGGHLGTVTSQESATALAWTLLRRFRPPRNVTERHEGSGG